MVRFSNGWAIVIAIAMVLAVQNLDSYVWTVFEKMEAISQDFELSAHEISNPIRNLDHLHLQISDPHCGLLRILLTSLLLSFKT